METLKDNARTILIFQELQNLERQKCFTSKVNAVQKNKGLLKQGKWLPGNTILVGADKISSPTTESDRIGVYLGKKGLKC